MATSLNPLSIDHVLENVFQYLGLDDLKSVRKVCLSWKDAAAKPFARLGKFLIQSEQDFVNYKTMNTVHSSILLEDSFGKCRANEGLFMKRVISLLAEFGSSIKEIDFRKLNSLEEVMGILKKCPQLEKFTLFTVPEIVDLEPYRSLSFPSVTSLTLVTVIAFTDATVPVIKLIIRLFPNLTTLTSPLVRVPNRGGICYPLNERRIIMDELIVKALIDLESHHLRFVELPAVLLTRLQRNNQYYSRVDSPDIYVSATSYHRWTGSY